MGCCALILKSFGSQIKSLASNPIPPEHSYREQLRNTSLFSLSSHPRSSSPLHPASLALPFLLATPPTHPNDFEWGLGRHPWWSTHCPASDRLYLPAVEDPAFAPGRSGDALWSLPALLSLSIPVPDLLQVSSTTARTQPATRAGRWVSAPCSSMARRTLASSSPCARTGQPPPPR